MEVKGSVALVTGANGFVGSRVTHYLANLGATVRALVRRPREHESLAGDGVSLVQGDVTDAAALVAAVQGVNLIVHCAAVAGPDLETSLQVNGQGTANLVAAALAAGCERFIHISTTSVYDRAATGPIDENSPLVRDGNPYEQGKIAAEQAVREGMARGLAATILRPPVILGAHPTSTWGVRVPQALAQGRFKLAGDGSGRFGYLHVENLAHAVVLAAEAEAAVGQVYNILDGHLTWREYVEQACRWVGVDPTSVPRIPPDQAPPVLTWQGQYSTEKAARELGYVPRADLADALTESARYFAANRSG